MRPVEQFETILRQPGPVLALAPMQDVTDRAFWGLMARYGGADLYFTEYFRVHSTSRLDRDILPSIADNPTGKPAIAQLIGNDPVAMTRAAKELHNYPIAGVDLNLGCPAPVVYRKCAGGGLLRDPALVDRLLGALREVVSVKFTVKTRIGFDDASVFEQLLPVFARHDLDLLTVHGRTVKEMYRSAVHYEFIARAADVMNCPVLANGNVYSADKALDVTRETGARGVMIGRGAIRNPWMFDQIRRRFAGEAIVHPTGREVLGYLRELHEIVRPRCVGEKATIARMKKYLNYIGVGIEPDGRFLHAVRRCVREREFFDVCAAFLEHDNRMPLEPFSLNLHERDVVAGEMR